MPLALVVAAIVIALAVFTARQDKKWARGIALGAVAMIVAAALGGLVTSQLATAIEKLHTTTTWGGQLSWSGIYALAWAMLTLSIAAGTWALVRRWGSREALHVGALIVWGGLACFTAMKLPGASYLFAWPLLAVAIADVVEMVWRDCAGARAARWVATTIAASFPVPVCFTTDGYILPLEGPGGIAMGVLVPMLAWLLAPQLESFSGLMGDERLARSAGLMLVASLALIAGGAATVGRDDARPTRENLVYVTSLDADSAWLVEPAAAMREGSFSVATRGDAARRLPPQTEADSAMRWIHAAFGSPHTALAVRGEARVIADGPDVSVVADTLVGDRCRGSPSKVLA